MARLGDSRRSSSSGSRNCSNMVISTTSSFEDWTHRVDQRCVDVAFHKQSLSFSSHYIRSAVILALIFLPLLVDSRAVSTSSPISMRWSRPCVFNQDTQLPASDSPSTDDTSTSVFIEESTRSSSSLRQSLNGIASKARHLREHVLRLKRDYVNNNRIQDQNVANDLEKQEFHIIGMPTRVHQNYPNGNTWTTLELRSQVNETVSHFFEDMARVSIFLEFAKRREEAEPGFSFAEHYQRIQNQNGFYWIMCKLQHISQTESGDDVPILHPAVHEAIANIRPLPAESRVYGYYHDYLVLSNVERLLSHLMSHSQHLASLH